MIRPKFGDKLRTKTVRKISIVAQEKIALNFLFTAANKCRMCNAGAEILPILFGNIVRVTHS